MKWIDIPPVWLLAAVIATWFIGHAQPFGLSLDFPITQLLGGLLVGAGIILMALAAMEMHKQRTTIIPHKEADSLVTSGIFKRTRNPIYLGDAAILAGLALRWDAVLALFLVPIFIWIIEKRFIIPEENMLRRKFRADFAHYEQKTRRWV
ncbi:MAG: isoprenylcysteine carboxylmethyltransferase family protein [Yoonia sp.]